MMRMVVAYGAALVVFLAIDAVYLGTVGAKMFKETLGDVLAPSFSIAPAVVFYLIYPVGLVIFATAPAFETGRWTTALAYGALFGFFAYATYDLTNWATLRNWTSTLTLVDVAWGTFVSAVAASAAFWITRATVGTG